MHKHCVIHIINLFLLPFLYVLTPLLCLLAQSCCVNHPFTNLHTDDKVKNISEERSFPCETLLRGS